MWAYKNSKCEYYKKYYYKNNKKIYFLLNTYHLNF